MGFFLNSCSHQPLKRAINSDQNSPGTDFIELLASKDRGIVTDPSHETQILYTGERTQKAALLIHGLHESPSYMKGLAKFYKDEGYNVVSLRLPGHMTKDRDGLNRVKFNEWVEAAENGYQAAKSMGNEVEIAGYSTGGTLAVYLALEHPDDVKKIVMIAPALALSNFVFFSTLTLGQGSIDSGKICKTVDSKGFLCRALQITDEQIKPMLKEGLVASPSAGFQVQKLIQFINDKFGEKRLSSDEQGMSADDGYYKKLEEVYLKLTIPILMVNSEADKVVNWKFNNAFAEHYPGRKEVILYKKAEKINHIMINKSSLDHFKSDPSISNPYFDEIFAAIRRL